MKLLTVEFLPPAVTSLHFGPTILLSALFWNTVTLGSCPSVGPPSFTQMQRTGKILVFCVVGFSYLDRTREGSMELLGKFISSSFLSRHTSILDLKVDIN